MNRGSIRFRITAVATVAVAVVLTIAAIALVLVQRSQLVAGVDNALVQRAADVEALLADSDPIPSTLGGSEDGFVQLVSTSGEVISSSPNLTGAAPLPLTAPASGAVLSTIEVPAVDDDVFRVITQRSETIAGEALLHVGVSLDDAMESVAILAGSLAVTIPAVVLLLAALVWWLVGRTLAPVEGIRAEVAAIGEGNLGRRVPQPSGDDEVSRLATTMNQMLDRLETSVATRQAFVADASHELRGPLTRIRSMIEVEMADLPEGEVRDTLGGVLQEVIGLQRLVEDLLHLARSDAGRASARKEPVDLDDLVLEEAMRVKATGRVDVDVSAVSAALVRGDRHQLARVVANLMDNAERHASERVRVALSEDDSGAMLVVEDDGPGIPEGEEERVFERFTRLDQARSWDLGGTGLGLAIAREIVERHGGTITVGSTSDGGARFEVRFPREEAEQSLPAGR